MTRLNCDVVKKREGVVRRRRLIWFNPIESQPKKKNITEDFFRFDLNGAFLVLQVHAEVFC